MLFIPKRLINTGFIEQLTDVSTTSTSFVDLFTLTYTHNMNVQLLIDFSACITTTAATDGAKFKLVCDSIDLDGCTAAGGRNGASSPGYCAALSGVSRALFTTTSTIKVQWSVATAGTASILPVTGNGHACLFIAEISIEGL